jgi:gliding motility-associated-like protein
MTSKKKFIALIILIPISISAQYGRTRGNMRLGCINYDIVNNDSCIISEFAYTPNEYPGVCVFHHNNKGKLQFVLGDSQFFDENKNVLYSHSRLFSNQNIDKPKILLPFSQNQFSIINSVNEYNPLHKLDLFTFNLIEKEIINDSFNSISDNLSNIVKMDFCRIDESSFMFVCLTRIKDSQYALNFYLIEPNQSTFINTLYFNCAIDRFNGAYSNKNTQITGNISSFKLSHSGKYLVVTRHQKIDEIYSTKENGTNLLKPLDNCDEIISYHIDDNANIMDSTIIIRSTLANNNISPTFGANIVEFSPNDEKLYIIVDEFQDSLNSRNLQLKVYDYNNHELSQFYNFPNNLSPFGIQHLYWGDLIVATINGDNTTIKVWPFRYSDSTQGYVNITNAVNHNTINPKACLGFIGDDSYQYVLNYLQPKLILTNPCKLRYRMENTKRLPNRFDKFTLYTKPVGTIDYTDSQEVTTQPYFFPSPGKYAYYIRGSNSSTGYSEVYEDTLNVPDPRDPDFRNQIQPEILVVSTKDNFTNEVLWNPIPMAHHYQVFRDDAFLGNSSLNAFSDKFNRPINQSHTYYIIAEDSCEYLTKKSQTVKTIFLSNADDNSQVNMNTPSSVSLTWNSYEGWSDPNPEYLLFTGNTNQIWESVGVSGQNSYFQNNINPDTWDQNHKEFYIQARNEKDIISRSNMLKVPLKPILYIPNVFTPNEDEKNDAFQLYSQGWKSLNYQVYNRWGQKVFETTDNNKNWVPGSQLSTGIFILKVQGEDLYQHKHYFKQVVYLLR